MFLLPVCRICSTCIHICSISSYNLLDARFEDTLHILTLISTLHLSRLIDMIKCFGIDNISKMYSVTTLMTKIITQIVLIFFMCIRHLPSISAEFIGISIHWTSRHTQCLVNTMNLTIKAPHKLALKMILQKKFIIQFIMCFEWVENNVGSLQKSQLWENA
jgi:hypothetical protein